MPADRNLLLSDLERDEGMRLVAYDDKTGQTLHQGDIIRGNITVGIGLNLMVAVLTPDQWRTICGWVCDGVEAELFKALPWALHMTEPRQRALGEMAFNLGVEKLLTFDTFLHFLEQGAYASAALDLRGTVWYHQVGQRGPRIVALIQNGNGNGNGTP